jgi:hypothetical protein
MGKRYDLLSNQAADSNPVVVQPGGWHLWRAQATWGVHSLKLQMQMGDGTYADIPGKVLDATVACMEVFLPSGATVKAVRNGTPTAIYSDLCSA